MTNNQSRKPRKQRNPEWKPTRVKDGSFGMFNDELVNRSKAAEIVRTTPATISKWIALPNGLPHIRLNGRLLFSPARMLAWIMERETQSNPTKRGR